MRPLWVDPMKLTYVMADEMDFHSERHNVVRLAAGAYRLFRHLDL